MILVWLIVILMAGGLLAWLSKKINPELPRWVALGAVLLDLILIVYLWISTEATTGSAWLIRYDIPWIPQWGVSFSLALDGLSLLMLLLTFFLGLLSVLISWKEIKNKVGFFHFNLLWALAGITGVFLTMDLFLFYFFWEVMLIPMYFLIGVWGMRTALTQPINSSFSRRQADCSCCWQYWDYTLSTAPKPAPIRLITSIYLTLRLRLMLAVC